MNILCYISVGLDKVWYYVYHYVKEGGDAMVKSRRVIVPEGGESYQTKSQLQRQPCLHKWMGSEDLCFFVET